MLQLKGGAAVVSPVRVLRSIAEKDIFMLGQGGNTKLLMGDVDGLPNLMSTGGKREIEPLRHIELERTPCSCLVSEDTQILRDGDSRWPRMNRYQSLSAKFDDEFQFSRVLGYVV